MKIVEVDPRTHSGRDLRKRNQNGDGSSGSSCPTVPGTVGECVTLRAGRWVVLRQTESPEDLRLTRRHRNPTYVQSTHTGNRTRTVTPGSVSRGSDDPPLGSGVWSGVEPSKTESQRSLRRLRRSTTSPLLLLQDVGRELS